MFLSLLAGSLLQATPWAGAMSEQIGLIGTHWSKGWIIEDNTISHSMNTGNLLLSRIPLRDMSQGGAYAHNINP